MGKKMSADGKPARGHMRILTDSARKRNRKEVLANYNKTRINIGHNMIVGWNWKKQWEFKLILKCEHQCHCTCNSEIGTCIINDAGRQMHTKNNENTRFLVESRQTMFYTRVLKVILTLNAKKKLSKKLPNSTTLYL